MHCPQNKNSLTTFAKSDIRKIELLDVKIYLDVIFLQEKKFLLFVSVQKNGKDLV